MQGIDYIYTITGALKAINEPTLTAAKDPGRDGHAGSPNQQVKPDAFGMQLHYYNNDYQSKDANTAFAHPSVAGFYNGNAATMFWKTKHNSQTYAYNYSYDHRNQMYAERDSETGLSAFMLRQYDGRIGRWTTRDVARQFPQGIL